MLFPSRRPTFWLSTAFGQKFFCRVMLNWKIGIWADFFLKKHRMNNSYDVFYFFILFIYYFFLQMNYSYDVFSEKFSGIFKLFLNFPGFAGVFKLFFGALFQKKIWKIFKNFFLPNASKNIFFFKHFSFLILSIFGFLKIFEIFLSVTREFQSECEGPPKKFLGPIGSEKANFFLRRTNTH